MNDTTMHKQFFASSPKKKNRFHVAVGLSLNISDTLGSPLHVCASFFLFLPDFDVFSDLLQNRRTTTWNDDN